jgi:transcriptional regulator with XRE-family HTH domain
MVAVQRIGEKLRTLRLRRGYTTRELAPLLGTSNSFITQVEKGKATPSTHLVLKIADLFGVTTDQLMRDELEVDG